MSPRFRVRLLPVFVVLLMVGSPAATSATARESLSTHAFLDLGDDDGDGIPAYLDPDDDDDGTTDEDSQNAPNPDGGNGDETVPEGSHLPGNTGTAENIPVQAASVTSLPNTGSGSVNTSGANLTLLLGGLTLLLVSGYVARGPHQRP